MNVSRIEHPVSSQPEFTFTGDLITGSLTIGERVGLTVADTAP